MLVSELEGKELSHWVAIAQDWDHLWSIHYPALFTGSYVWQKAIGNDVLVQDYHPHDSDAQAGALLGEFKLHIHYSESRYIWKAAKRSLIAPSVWSKGTTWQVAVCRAIIAIKFGEEINE